MFTGSTDTTKDLVQARYWPLGLPGQARPVFTELTLEEIHDRQIGNHQQ